MKLAGDRNNLRAWAAGSREEKNIGYVEYDVMEKSLYKQLVSNFGIHKRRNYREGIIIIFGEQDCKI